MQYSKFSKICVMAELVIAHKVMLMKCLHIAPHKTFSMAHIRNSLAMCSMKRSRRIKTC